MSVKGQGPRDAARRISQAEYAERFEAIDWSRKPGAEGCIGAWSDEYIREHLNDPALVCEDHA